MKTPDQILDAIAQRVAGTWHRAIAGHAQAWPHTFPLGAPTRTELETGFAGLQQRSLLWQQWAEHKGLTLTTATRRVHGTAQLIPTHLTVPDLDTAAGLLGAAWTHRIHQGRDRLSTLRQQFPDAPDHATIVRAADAYSDHDFDLLRTAAAWFRSNSASGLTPRQVPIEGLHAKWLNTHRHLVLDLAGIDTLGLLPNHPPRVHFTYLDPGHLTGGRRHDSITIGDTAAPAYTPKIVIISENKDTAIHFPALPEAIAVEGAGFGAAALAQIDWIATAPQLIYWGDIDPAGFEIVDNFRREGLPVRTILMDQATYQTYERFGAPTDAKGRPLRAPAPKPVPHLTDAERAMYDHLTDPDWTRVRRIEQERIPLAVALDSVRNLGAADG